MHVVGEERASVAGEAAGDCPVVAADGSISVNSQLPTSNSQLSLANAQQAIDQSQRSVGFLLDRANDGPRVLRLFVLRMALAGAARSQVVDIGPGDRRCGLRASHDRRVPLRSHRREEVRHRLRQHVVHRPQRRLV